MIYRIKFIELSTMNFFQRLQDSNETLYESSKYNLKTKFARFIDLVLSSILKVTLSSQIIKKKKKKKNHIFYFTNKTQFRLTFSKIVCGNSIQNS